MFLNVVDRDRRSLYVFASQKTSGVTDRDIL